MIADVLPRHVQDPVRAFVETLLDEAGFATLSAAERADAVAALTAEAERRVGLALHRAVDGETLKGFESLADRRATEEEVAAFFDLRVPQAESIVRTALSAFGTECLETAKSFERVAA